MLDDASLAHKAAVARSWFRKARTGQLSFSKASAEVFEQLLEAIEFAANTMEAENNILKAQATVRDFEVALHLPPALGAAPNVVRFPSKGKRR